MFNFWRKGEPRKYDSYLTIDVYGVIEISHFANGKWHSQNRAEIAKWKYLKQPLFFRRGKAIQPA